MVDRIIRARLRLPTYRTWRRRRIKELEEMRRPEHWGLTADHVLVREVRPAPEARVLVAGAVAGESALFLAANGCEVTTVNEEADDVMRVLEAAEDHHCQEDRHENERHYEDGLDRRQAALGSSEPASVHQPDSSCWTSSPMR